MQKLMANPVTVHLLGLTLLMTPSCAAAQNQQPEQVEIQLSNAGFEARDADDSEAGAWLSTTPYVPCLAPPWRPETGRQLCACVCGAAGSADVAC